MYIDAGEEERMRMEQLATGWDDPTQVSWGEAEAAPASATAQEPAEPLAAPLYKCTALYSYSVRLVDSLLYI